MSSLKIADTAKKKSNQKVQEDKFKLLAPHKYSGSKKNDGEVGVIQDGVVVKLESW